MKIAYLSALLSLVAVVTSVACAPQTAPADAPATVVVEQATSAVEPTQEIAKRETPTPGLTTEAAEEEAPTSISTAEVSEETTPVVTSTAEAPVVGNLPSLPRFVEANANGIGDPLPGGEVDPFADAVFVLDTSLPEATGRAVVEQHSFGKLNAARARAVADRFGFSGPLYIQQIAPEFAPPPGQDATAVYTGFQGVRIMNLSDSGVTYEDRGIIVDFNQKPLFSEVAPLVEAQLEAWGLLEFPYELQQSDFGDLQIYRLIDGVPVEQNAYNILVNQDGEIAYLDYHPLREIEVVGPYPLRSAQEAWQKLQTAEGRTQVRYQLYPMAVEEEPADDFVNPRSWAPLVESGQEVHLYMTPAVYGSIDDGSLRIMYGNFTLTGDDEALAEIATHLVDVLHVWGEIVVEEGTNLLAVRDWELLDRIEYLSLEGTIAHEEGQALLQTHEGETFVLPGAPVDLPEGVEVYANAAARRESGATYPLLDWLTLTEKVDWPDVVVQMEADEAAPIATVTVDSAKMVYFTLYQSIDSTDAEAGQLFVPVWKFDGSSDQGHAVTFWVPAIAAEYQQ